MKLKVSQVMNSLGVLVNIINRQAPMPQRGKYLIARMYAKLLPEAKIIEARRDEMVKAYNTPRVDKTTDPATGTVTETAFPGEFMVPPDKLAEFQAAWDIVAAEEIDVDVQPMPLIALCPPNAIEGLIEASEFLTLDSLVYDNAN